MPEHEWKFRVGNKVRVVAHPKYPKVDLSNGEGVVVYQLHNTPGAYGVQFSHAVRGGHDCDLGTGRKDCLWLVEDVLEVIA
jgi:hypothetical protein